jgi:hypothetical protein
LKAFERIGIEISNKFGGSLMLLYNQTCRQLKAPLFEFPESIYVGILLISHYRHTYIGTVAEYLKYKPFDPKLNLVVSLRKICNAKRLYKQPSSTVSSKICSALTNTVYGPNPGLK